MINHTMYNFKHCKMYPEWKSNPMLFILFDFGWHQTSNQLAGLFIFVLQQTSFQDKIKKSPSGLGCVKDRLKPSERCSLNNIMTNKLLMKAKLPSGCQNFTFNEAHADMSLFAHNTL